MYLLSLALREKQMPKGLSMIHGVMAVVGLALLIYYVATHDAGPTESMIVLILAAMGGLLLLYKDLTGRKPPKWLAVAHGLVALTGYVLLIVFAVD